MTLVTGNVEEGKCHQKFFGPTNTSSVVNKGKGIRSVRTLSIIELQIFINKVYKIGPKSNNCNLSNRTRVNESYRSPP